MQRYHVSIILLLFLFLLSCQQEKSDTSEVVPQFNNELTAEEKAGGVMTPEIMLKFGRLGSFALSPDGSTVLYTVTDIDLETEVKRINIFKVPADGGDPVQLTTDGGSSPQWFNKGKSVAYINNDGELITVNTDGSDKQIVKDFKDFEIFNISPDGNNIYFTRRVKLDQTANEKYNLPKANVRIIDDLMYRHWNYWSDYSYSHIFVASFNGKSISGEKDIMEGQRFESPLAPYFDEGEISWSPDSKLIAYTTKRLRGKEDARSTNSDIILYNIASGEEVNISESNRGYDRYPVFSPDGSKIAFQSMEREGYEADLDRLFVYDIDKGTLRWVTKGWDFDVESINWADNETIFFACAHLGTTQVFKTSISARGVDQVTDGVHELSPISLKSGIMVANIKSLS